jgi:recombination protein RecA
MNKEKIRRAKSVMAAINKKYTKKGEDKRELIQAASEINEDYVTPPRRRFNIEALNQVTGGGIPYGRSVQIFGGSDCGKTTACLDLVAAAQARGELVAWIGFEPKFDKGWAVKRGVRWDDTFFYVATADYAEQGLQVIIDLTKESAVDLVVVDSVVALSPRAELYDGKGETGRDLVKDTQALIARMLSQFFRMLTAYSTRTGCSFVFINQLREKIGAYGNPETTPGGRALGHYVALNIGMRRAGSADTLEYAKSRGGYTAKLICKKMQVSPAVGYSLIEEDEHFVSFIPNKGFIPSLNLAEIAMSRGFVEKEGRSNYVMGEFQANGKDNFFELVMNNEDAQKYILGQLGAADESSESRDNSGLSEEAK